MVETQTNRPLWELLLLIQEAKEPLELTCEECYVLLDYDTDLVRMGAMTDKTRAAIHHHLSICSVCMRKLTE